MFGGKFNLNIIVIIWNWYYNIRYKSKNLFETAKDEAWRICVNWR